MFVAVTGIVIILDRISKAMVSRSLQLGESKTLINNILSFSLVHNDGAAYSLLQGKQSLLIVFSLVLMLAVLAYFIVYRSSLGFAERLAFALIFGGGIGNLIDRVMNGYVVDFINIYIIPVFNVADIAISCGCVLFALSVLLDKKK